MEKSLDTDLSQALIPLRSLDINSVQGRIRNPPLIDRQSPFYYFFVVRAAIVQNTEDLGFAYLLKIKNEELQKIVFNFNIIILWRRRTK
jgi:hypothetical protein